jgi:hypothetical protein
MKSERQKQKLVDSGCSEGAAGYRTTARPCAAQSARLLVSGKEPVGSGSQGRIFNILCVLSVSIRSLCAAKFTMSSGNIPNSAEFSRGLSIDWCDPLLKATTGESYRGSPQELCLGGIPL